MVSDYAYNGPVGMTMNMLLEHHPKLRTYFYQFSFSGSQSLCDKHIYYGWKYSIKLQLQNLGLGKKDEKAREKIALILLGKFKQT